MRKLTSRAEQREALYLRDALTGGEVHASIKRDGDGAFAIWVHRDSELDHARELLRAFELDPNDPRIRDLVERASALRALTRRQRVDRDPPAPPHPAATDREDERSPMVSVFLAVTIGMVAFFTDVGKEHMHLFSLDPQRVMAGEWWRLVLPMFAHDGMLHLVFNVYMLIQLGTLSELHFGSRHLFAQTLLYGVLSIAAASVFSVGAQGFSGVIYGYFGFLWMRGRLDPRAPFALAPSLVFLMLLWLVIGVAVPRLHISNSAHISGLLLGMLWGVGSALRARSR